VINKCLSRGRVNWLLNFRRSKCASIRWYGKKDGLFTIHIDFICTRGKFNHRSLVWALIRSEKQQVRFSRGCYRLNY